VTETDQERPRRQKALASTFGFWRVDVDSLSVLSSSYENSFASMRWSKPEYYANHHENDQCGKDDYRKVKFIDFHQELSTWCMGNGSASSPYWLSKVIL